MDDRQHDQIDLAITDVRFIGVDSADGSATLTEHQSMEGTPFAGRDFRPNNWRAYMHFKIQHAMPSVAGPTMKGNYLAYHPAVIERSLHGLLHQQVNLEHRIKRYNPDRIPRDRIVGAVVDVHFPKAPMTGWKIPEDPTQAPHISAVATIFKQAEGVPKVLGEHQSSKEVWNNSIEVVYPLDEIGVYIPSRRELIKSASELPAAMKGVLYRDPKTRHLLIGKYKGEQLAMAPGGLDGTIDYQGVGMTKWPAEREAEIEQVLASARQSDFQSEMREDGRLVSLPQTEHSHVMAMFRRGVSFLDARGRRVWARVKEVTQEGQVKLAGTKIEATPENPVLLVETMVDGRKQELLRSLRGVFVV